MDNREKLLRRLRKKRSKLRKLKRLRARKAQGIGGKVAAERLARIIVNPMGNHQLTALQARANRAAKARWLKHPPTLTIQEQEVMAAYDSGMPAHQVEAQFSLTKLELFNLRRRAARVEKWRRLAIAITADPRLADLPTEPPRTPAAAMPGAQKGYIDASDPAAPRMVYTEGFRTVSTISSSTQTGSKSDVTTSPGAGATGDTTESGGGSAGGRGNPGTSEPSSDSGRIGGGTT